MRTAFQTVKKKENGRRLLAAAFLLFLVVEFGSHTAAHAFSSLASYHPAIYSNDGGHEDPCEGLVLCSESRREKQQMPSPAHQTAQQNAMLDLFSPIPPTVDLREEPSIPFGTAEAVFRPVSPPFHPPELN